MVRSLYISLVYGVFLCGGFVAPFVLGLGYVWVDTFTPQNVAYSILNEFPVSVVMAVAAVGLYVLADRRDPPGLNAVSVLVAAMAAWVTFTTWYDPVAPAFAVGKWNWAIKTIVFSAFMPALFRSRVQIEALLQVWVFSLAGQFLPFAAKTILTGGKYGASYGLVAGNSGLAEGAHLATVCLMILPVIVHLARFSIILPRASGLRLMYGGLAVACLVACVGTFERTALVGAAVLAACMVLRSRRRLVYALLGAGAIAAASLYVATSNSDWGARMKTISAYPQENSAYVRILVWRWTLDFVQTHPWGGGFNAYVVDEIQVPGTPEQPGPTTETARAFHSIYFEMLGEHGFVGLALFVALCGASLLTLGRAACGARRIAGMAWCHDLARALQISLVVEMVCGAFIGIAFQAEIYYLFALAVMLRHQVRSANRLADASGQPAVAGPGLRAVVCASAA
jgi:probable O-glycosylation ligase (exosortase A-associated)